MSNHIIVIGGGILGLSISFDLLELDPNIKVTNIYPASRKGAGTLCAGAMLNSFAEIDKYSLKSDESLAHFTLSYEATKAWPKFEERLIRSAGESLPQGCSKCQILGGGGCYGTGTYVINNTSADSLDDANYNSIKHALEEFNEPYSEIDPQLIQGYKPEPRHRATRALLIHNEGWLNPKLVLEKMDRLLKKNQRYTHLDANCVTYNKEFDLIKSVTLDNTDIIYGDIFCNASGFDLSHSFTRSGLNDLVPNIYSGIGISIEVKATHKTQVSCIRTPNRGGACGLYTVPYFWGPTSPNDHILIGASSFIDTSPHFHGRAISIAHLLESATLEINQEFYKSEVISINVGNRPTTFDQYPIIGKTKINNLYVAGGTKRDGFHLAPLISKYIAQGILDINQDYSELFRMFSPNREIIRDISYEEGIVANIESLMSEAYQHGFHSSTIRQVDQLLKSFEKEVRSTHNDFSNGKFGIPVLMYKLVRDRVINCDHK